MVNNAEIVLSIPLNRSKPKVTINSTRPQPMIKREPNQPKMQLNRDLNSPRVFICSICGFIFHALFFCASLNWMNFFVYSSCCLDIGKLNTQCLHQDFLFLLAFSYISRMPICFSCIFRILDCSWMLSSISRARMGSSWKNAERWQRAWLLTQLSVKFFQVLRRAASLFIILKLSSSPDRQKALQICVILLVIKLENHNSRKFQ